MRKAIFLDRDGTLNIDTGYVSRVEDFVLFDDVLQALGQFQKLDFDLVVVTNQSGIGRGLITPSELEILHSHLKNELSDKNVQLLDIYFCPHRPDEGCSCRKPNTDLIIRAAEKHEIDLEQSYIVGDRLHDLQAGRSTGLKTIWLKRATSHPEASDQDQCEELADYTATSLLDAVSWVDEIEGGKDLK